MIGVLQKIIWSSISMVGTTLQFMTINDYKGRVSKNTQRPYKFGRPNPKTSGLSRSFFDQYNKIGNRNDLSSFNWSRTG